MYRPILAAVAALVLAGPAVAADRDANKDPGQTAAVSNAYVNDWRAKDVIGKNVYGANNEKIGEIKELMINPQGQVHAAIVDVGGFLGVGEHSVAMDWKNIKFNQQEDKFTANATKDQLKAMPEFKFAEKTRDRDVGQQTGAAPANKESGRPTGPTPQGSVNR